jgi:hypothetical protein
MTDFSRFTVTFDTGATRTFATQRQAESWAKKPGDAKRVVLTAACGTVLWTAERTPAPTAEPAV